jgi:ABC-type uncharacterized transport system substrate-binding protein
MPYIPPTPTPSQIQEESLYWEKDDINPNQVIYDLENNKVIIPDNEDEIIEPEVTQEGPKLIIKNVSNTRYRNNR